MRTTASIAAIDLGASGGKCFAGLFNEGSFTLREIHRFSHEADRKSVV
jgi:sugar (pentulose or hexulose) kinase